MNPPTPPVNRQLIVEADGGSRGNPGVAGAGALVRDTDGQVLAQRAQPLGTASNNVAEYSGLIDGLELALQLADGDPVDVEVRMDSKLVIEQMSGRWKIKHDDMRRLAGQAKDLVRRLADQGGTCRFRWIPRERNTAADRLSNLAMDGQRIDQLAPHDDPDAPATEPDDEPRPPATEVDDEPQSDTRDADSQPQPPVSSPVLPRQRTADQGPGVRLVLARHAVTDSSTMGLMDGRGGVDAPLNAEGTRQAQLLAAGVRAFLGAVPAVVISSGLRRAQQTARHVAAAFDVSPETDDDWDELHFGEWNGRAMREVWAQDPDGLTRLLTDPSQAPPSGESRDDLSARVIGAAERALARAREREVPVVVVTHRGPLIAALAHLIGCDVLTAETFETGPASMTSLRRWADGKVLVEFVNDRSHLRAHE